MGGNGGLIGTMWCGKSERKLMTEIISAGGWGDTACCSPFLSFFILYLYAFLSFTISFFLSTFNSYFFSRHFISFHPIFLSSFHFSILSFSSHLILRLCILYLYFLLLALSSFTFNVFQVVCLWHPSFCSLVWETFLLSFSFINVLTPSQSLSPTHSLLSFSLSTFISSPLCVLPSFSLLSPLKPKFFQFYFSLSWSFPLSLSRLLSFILNIFPSPFSLFPHSPSHLPIFPSSLSHSFISSFFLPFSHSFCLVFVSLSFFPSFFLLSFLFFLFLLWFVLS